ncbi:hypothetical protein F2Q69_00010079 [Brassica cretica]|uniref:DUF4283 domain-containing protein n=1 Tax=Brassica cretica TaxID=69181 RepID=A0A8S9P8K7_BRACR|nr:hypothetical protein F2Q69_00010079 [Brassica cretica]
MGSTFHMKSAHQAALKGKGILYEDDDEPVKLVDRDDSFIIKEFGLTLIGKILNPKKQNFEKLLQTMPSQWGLADRITANDLGNGKFLFNFTNEEDLNYVAAKGPFHFNFCMFVLVRWEPIVHDDYPWIIPCWVQLIGFPLHLWTDTNLRNIGGRIGHIDTMELMEGRLLIDVDSRRPLKFSRKVEYEGDEVTIEIKYEMLFKHCTTCGMPSHEKGYCPSIGIRQPTVERSDVFTRMQLLARQSVIRDTQGNDRSYHQPSLKIREPHSRNYAEYAPRHDLRHNLRDGNNSHPRSWIDNRRLGNHADRIIIHKDDYKRSNIYGGGRARTGPYDRVKEASWRAKPRITETKENEQNGDGLSVMNNEIVPYEHISGAGPLDSQSLSMRKKTDAVSTRKLASAIVTPSRLDLTMEDNVTVQGRSEGSVDGRALTFSPQSGKELFDDQIIGALSDMDIVEQQDKGMMDVDDNDDDLLGADLLEMEGDRFNGANTKEKGENVEIKPVRHMPHWVAQAGSLRSSVGGLQASETKQCEFREASGGTKGEGEVYVFE